MLACLARPGVVSNNIRAYGKGRSHPTRWCRPKLEVRTDRGWSISGNAPLNTISAGRPSTPALLKSIAPQLPLARQPRKSPFEGAWLKKPEAKATAPPKAKAKPLTDKDNKLAKTVKDQGKQRAKKKAAVAAKGDK